MVDCVVNDVTNFPLILNFTPYSYNTNTDEYDKCLPNELSGVQYVLIEKNQMSELIFLYLALNIPDKFYKMENPLG